MSVAVAAVNNEALSQRRERETVPNFVRSLIVHGYGWMSLPWKNNSFSQLLHFPAVLSLLLIFFGNTFYEYLGKYDQPLTNETLQK